MLALTRKVDQAIIVNDNIKIKILSVSGDKVKIGIEAPKDITIYREEIYAQVLESNQNAVCINMEALQSIKGQLK